MAATEDKSTPERSAQLENWFREYEGDHLNPNNKLTHMVGIPMIVLALVKLLQRVPLGPTNLALIAVIALTVFFARHDRKLGLSFGAALFVIYVFTFIFIPVKLAWVLFVVGWILQLVGHYKYEKRAPSFFKNLLHLLIGPIWILARVTGQR